MNARTRILQAVTANKPAPVELPELLLRSSGSPDPVLDRFITSLTAISAQAIQVNNIYDIKEDLAQAIARGGYIVNTIAELGIVNDEVNEDNDAVFLEHVQQAYIRGSLGVAENGAIWISESNMKNRLLPFICEHLVLIVNQDQLVPDMHAAYEQVKIDAEGFGVFIAGPSRTADIEQSLVIGAHGAKRLSVYLIG